MQVYEVALPMVQPQHRSHDKSDYKGERIYLEVEQELAVLSEWGQVQKNIFSHIFSTSVPASSWRSRIEASIHQCTHGQAQILWEPLSSEDIPSNCYLIEICYQQIRYGMLKLAPGYLVSHLVPDLHQTFAYLCALIINLAEHQALVGSLLKPLQPLYGNDSLTAREKDVLEGMVLGESEDAIGQRLSIALTTVRTHRHSVYRRLEVRSPQEAVLRSFALRLLNWLDLSL